MEWPFLFMHRVARVVRGGSGLVLFTRTVLIWPGVRVVVGALLARERSRIVDKMNRGGGLAIWAVGFDGKPVRSVSMGLCDGKKVTLTLFW